jgi:hypothetical protein
MRRLLRRLLVVATVTTLLWIASSSAPASAKTSYDSPYTMTQTFGSALRFLRVDLGLKVIEKDADNGYLLFEYTSAESGKRLSSGSIELVKTAQWVHVTVKLPSMPQYHEQVFLDGLVKKLAAEHGDPAPKPIVEPDAGAGAGNSTDRSR